MSDDLPQVDGLYLGGGIPNCMQKSLKYRNAGADKKSSR